MVQVINVVVSGPLDVELDLATAAWELDDVDVTGVPAVPFLGGCELFPYEIYSIPTVDRSSCR